MTRIAVTGRQATFKDMAQRGKSSVSLGSRSPFVVSESFGIIDLEFLTKGGPHPCPYLPGREATEEVFIADKFPPELYHDFMNHGFRRSGRMFYRPVCENCRECRSLRIPVADFKPNKSQRRILRKNEDIAIRQRELKFSAEKYRIYAEYIAFKHTPGFQDLPEDMWRFLYNSPTRTVEFEYSLKGRLAAVGIVDACSRSLSSVYTYFDPEFASRSLGTFSALHEILLCNRQSVPYYYLGFQIADCPAMNYKTRFRPYELLTPKGTWVRPGES